MSTSTTAPAPTRRATLDDLLKVDGKAELINGRIVYQVATGYQPGRVGFRIARSLDDYADATGHGVALPDNVGFAVPELPSGRESFSPDASYFVGPLPANRMRFVEGPPTFAVEVRSENDYGEAAEEEMAAKRADYFQAGTLVVWDVDPIAESIRKYQATSPDQPSVFQRGDRADAEPAVPGWRIVVDRIFS
ncbi:MAG: Uma2 family endonuclease [Isosphaeraceae bacterium]